MISTSRIIECVPNFSEGRNAATVTALADAMSGVSGAYVLDRHNDPDHHRSVITVAGEPEAVREAALRGIGAAAKLINLEMHAGAHPRIGAADVVPFVPIRNVTMHECVNLAWRAGKEIWERYKIPVYFYEAAAKDAGRVALENVRKGQFEGLRNRVLLDATRAPDIGDPRLHPTAGAVAVGARKFLIAYNVNLNTADVSIAKKIARTIRASSGGLPCVKAMGVELKRRNLAQVSMNLTDFEQTPLSVVFEAIRREANRHGCGIAGSEIVGMIPARALEMGADGNWRIEDLQLEDFSAAQVIENRLAELDTEAGQRISVKDQCA